MQDLSRGFSITRYKILFFESNFRRMRFPRSASPPTKFQKTYLSWRGFNRLGQKRSYKNFAVTNFFALSFKKRFDRVISSLSGVELDSSFYLFYVVWKLNIFSAKGKHPRLSFDEFESTLENVRLDAWQNNLQWRLRLPPYPNASREEGNAGRFLLRFNAPF